MSLSSDLSRLQTAKANLKTAINAKGGILTNELLDAYANAVNTLPVGVSSGIRFDSLNANSQLIEATVLGSVLPVRSFYNSYLHTIHLPTELTIINSYAFAYSQLLILSVIPCTAVSLGSCAFQYCTALTHLALGSSNGQGVTSIASLAFQGATGLSKIWIPASCNTISAISQANTPFYQCSSNLQIYCEAVSKPSGWSTYWNYYGSGTQLTVFWGITKEQFDAL